MTTTTPGARALQAGQDYDPGYDVPDLRIGQLISGHTVVAAIREHDGPGLLPGLHIVTAYDPDGLMPYVTWETAWQRYSQAERLAMAAQRGIPICETEDGRWVAGHGHYLAGPAEALADMVIRAGVMREMARRIAGAMERSGSGREDQRAARRLRKWAA
jgi:hypothetical protein